MLYLSSNSLSSIFHGSIFSKFLRIARCKLNLTNLVLKVPQLYTRMINQGGNKASILRQIKKHSKILRNIFQVPRIVRHIVIQYKYCIVRHVWRNQRNNYVLTSKFQLGWQKLRIFVYVCMCVCVYMHMCI